MNASTKLVIALSGIFGTCILALALELVYNLWRQRRFRQRSSIVSGGGTRSVDSKFWVDSPFHGTAPSKELLYFFCWKNQPVRVEPSSGVTMSSPTTPKAAEVSTADGPETAAVEDDDDDDKLAKWQALYGQSRVLYTIKEDQERGGVHDIVDNSTADYQISEAENEKRVCLKDCNFTGGVDETADDVAVVVVDVVEEATPFSTPCASPPYYTPSPSPGRADVEILQLLPENDDVSSPDNEVLTDRKAGFVSLKIEGESNEFKL